MSRIDQRADDRSLLAWLQAAADAQGKTPWS
jgi:hypothetical protein